MAGYEDYLMAGAEGYYRQTEEKHFDDASGVGSVFTGVGSLRELVELGISQRGSLDGDDHDLLGSPSRPGVYFVAVRVEGLVGALPAAALADGEAVLARRSKDGVPPDLIVFGRSRVATKIATLVMADEVVDGAPTGRRILITCFPGPPLDPAGAHREEWSDNTVLSSGELDPGETVLLADPSCLGEETVAALSGLSGGFALDSERAASVLARVASASADVREASQYVLFEAARLDDGLTYLPEEAEWISRQNGVSALGLARRLWDADKPARLTMSSLKARFAEVPDEAMSGPPRT